MGHPFQCVGTGKVAVAEVKNQRYDLVLMDCQMPEMDGYEAARAFADGSGSRAPPDACRSSP